MKRISREAAWGILSNHKIVILGHGAASVEEHKKAQLERDKQLSEQQ